MKKLNMGRKLRHHFLFMLIVTLLFSVGFAETIDISTNTQEAVHNVSNYEEFAAAFSDFSDKVTIILEADISFDGKEPLSVTAEHEYTIVGNGFALAEAAFAGSGKVIISADCVTTAEGSGPALTAKEQVCIELEGNINAEGEGRDGAHFYNESQLHMIGNTVSLNGVGVCAYDDSKIEVQGDVTGGISYVDNPDVGISANGRAEFVIEGNVSSANGDAIKAYDDSKVQVVGNVSTASADGVDAKGNSSVEVTGDVFGGEGGEGVEANENAVVNVQGNVYGGNGRKPDAEGNLEHGSYYEADGYSDGGHGVQASGQSYVYVTGSVTGGVAYGTAAYGGDGVYAREQAEVHVEGTVTGGLLTADPNVVANASQYGVSGSGAHAESTATIHVYSDAIGADASAQKSKACPGILITLVVKDGVKEPGKVTVEGTSIGGKATAEDGLDSEAIFYSYMYSEGEQHYTIDEFLVPTIEAGRLSVTGEAELIGANADGLTEYVQENELVRIID